MKKTPKSQFVDSTSTAYDKWLYIDGWESHPPSAHGDRRIHYSEGDLTITQGNQVSRLGKTSERIGDDFRVYRKSFSEHTPFGEPTHFSLGFDPYANTMEHYKCIQVARFVDVSPSGSMWPAVSPSGFDTLDALGATAIARCTPTTPLFNLAAFLGELREGLPGFSLDSWKDRTLHAKGAGKDYLNYEFGWKPLVSDIRKAMHAATKSDKTLERYVRNSGKLIHKRYDFPIESSESVSTSSTWDYSHIPQPAVDPEILRLDRPPPTLTITQRTSTKRWFEGTFTYYLPETGKARDDALFRKMYGTKLTPEVVWQLTPWSWAADWVSNIGDVSRNVSNFMSDGLVMPYAYMMEHCASSVEYQLSGVQYWSYPGTHVLRQTFTSEVKTRRVATPYGFGLAEGDFTTRQLAIMAALGVSRA